MAGNHALIDELRIKNGDATLYCRVRGQGPSLLLIHGVACDADYFEEAAEYLSRRFRVITYDRRGYSRSTAGDDVPGLIGEPERFSVPEQAGEVVSGLIGKPERFSVSEQAEDAAEICRYCGRLPHHGGKNSGETEGGKDAVAKTFVVGSSAGCLVAAELARLHPELVNGLFLHEPVFGGDAGMKAEIDDLRGKLREAANKKRVVRAMRLFLEAMGGMDPEAKETPMEQLARNMKNLETFLDCEMDDFLTYEIAKIRNLRVPARIAVGECDEEGLFHRAAESAARTLCWPLVRVPGYHNFPSDMPREFSLSIKM